MYGDADRVSCGESDLCFDANVPSAGGWFGWRVLTVTVDALVGDGGHVVWSCREFFQDAFDHYRLIHWVYDDDEFSYVVGFEVGSCGFS